MTAEMDIRFGKYLDKESVTGAQQRFHLTWHLRPIVIGEQIGIAVDPQALNIGLFSKQLADSRLGGKAQALEQNICAQLLPLSGTDAVRMD